jgi:DNA repair exonuclease SbcCD ATPase subunit
MRAFHVAALAVLWMTGSISTACAQGHESRSAYEQDPPTPPPPPRPPPPGKDSEERREQIHRLEAEIRDLEVAIQRESSDDRRADLKRRLDDRKAHLKEVLGSNKRVWWADQQNPVHQKMARVEKQIHELEMKLQSKDMGPEDRKELTAQLDRAHAQMDELRAQARQQDPQTRKGPSQLGGPGMFPPDPESQKMHMEAQELERESMDLAGKLRRIPKDNKEDREETFGKLKESVTKLFDLREKLRAREVEMIKKRLEELTQLLEKRKTNRDAIIEKRMKQLTGEADELDW